MFSHVYRTSLRRSVTRYWPWSRTVFPRFSPFSNVLYPVLNQWGSRVHLQALTEERPAMASPKFYGKIPTVSASACPILGIYLVLIVFELLTNYCVMSGRWHEQHINCEIRFGFWTFKIVTHIKTHIFNFSHNPKPDIAVWKHPLIWPFGEISASFRLTMMYVSTR